MKRQKQTLAFQIPRPLLRSIGRNASLFGRLAIDVVYKTLTPGVSRKASQMLLAILFAACCGSAPAQTPALKQYQVSYLDDLGGTNSRGNSINNQGWIEGLP